MSTLSSLSNYACPIDPKEDNVKRSRKILTDAFIAFANTGANKGILYQQPHQIGS